MKTLTINLIGRYFHQIKAGTKVFEYRLRTPYWKRRLEGREYDTVRICLGYPSKDNVDRVITMPWRGYEL